MLKIIYKILLIKTVLVVLLQAEYSVERCNELGYIKGKLMCSSCEKLNDFGLEQLNSQCRQCCTIDELPAAQRRYAKAILEVCTCKFRAYPQIQAFIKSGRPAKFPNLTIKYVRGLDPTVKLLDAKGNLKETLSITKWNTDTVEEFFKTHLENTTPKSGPSKDTKNGFSIVEDSNHDNTDGEHLNDFLKTNQI